ncbi:MAG: hypothetical protein PHS57_03065 [Alphaproteobacteria bacterium]|nr:hypothetical protein [Alphaproteobacteria bacterium]
MMKILRRVVFSALYVAALAAAVHFSFRIEHPDYAMTGIYLTFSLFMLAFGWPELAKSISFLGSNIELREVKEAINELRPLAEVFSRSVIELMQGGSCWGGIPAEEKEKAYTSIEKMLKSLSFSKKEIEDILKRWHEWIETDYVYAIVLPHSSIDHPEVSKEKKKEWHSLYSALIEKEQTLSPDEIREAFRGIDCLSPRIETAISDYEFYKKNKKHQNIERWRQRENWFKK